MNDFEYDVMQRKNLARQARYRKTHTGKGGCRLSSDLLTPKQWKERCGAVVSCNMNKPMAWREFKNLSGDTQREYIEALVNKFEANATNLGEMFGVSGATVRRFFEMNDLGIQFQVGHSMTKQQRAMWRDFLTGGDAEPEPVPDVEPEPPEDHPNNNRKMCMTQFSLRFEGEIDVLAIANSIKALMAGSSIATITVDCAMN